MVVDKSSAWYRHLYVQVLLAVLLGIVVGRYFPDFGKSLKPFGDGFIKLVKMMVAPIVFCTIVHGIASMGDLKRLGKVGIKTLVYFEVVSTFALFIGLVVVNWIKPGEGFNPNGMNLVNEGTELIKKGQHLSTSEFLLKIIPDTFLGAFAAGDLLQVLLVSILVGFALNTMGERGHRITEGIDRASELFFSVLRIIVKSAPIGAFGAMAFTIGNFGFDSLKKLGLLMGSFYLTAALFIFIVLGIIARLAGFSVVRLIAYLKEELLLVLGTSSSETALPGMLSKLEKLGCKRSTVGLVIPTGYSFNLDGTNIYMTMAAIFLAQATHTPLTLGQQLTLLLVAMLTSKGATGVSGAGFITLAATLQSVPSIPIQSLVFIYGIDRFMSEGRALTNLIGNGVATLVISRWEKEISADELRSNLAAH